MTIAKGVKHQSQYSVLAIELEPTHYKTDFWNVVSASGLVDVFAIYTQAKNWSPDGGHNYLRFPESAYDHIVLTGRGMMGAIRSAIRVSRCIVTQKPDAVLICGYSQLPAMSALLTCFILRKNFLLFVDEFNNERPPGPLSSLKWIVREMLRKYCFAHATAVLVCGRKGLESAVSAGCPPAKIHDFPYTVDVQRILRDAPSEIPSQSLADLKNSVPVLFFSGRMIARKGLPTLLEALSNIEIGIGWVLWIEGAGPDLESYVALAHKYGLEDHCRFLGFCQYDLHSWLIRSADIVIVPSLEDNWGIVVDEGLQLGKIVISSDATGSGYDRIIDKSNGYIFPAGDSKALTGILQPLLNGRLSCDTVKENARISEKNTRPVDNLNTLMKIIRVK